MIINIYFSFLLIKFSCCEISNQNKKYHVLDSLISGTEPKTQMLVSLPME